MTSDRGQTLLTLARGSIGETFGEAPVSLPPESWLQEPGSTFVTLTLGGELRGCVGSLFAHKPLAEDVAFNARAAAFQDSRFSPLARGEFPHIEIEVSLLSTPETLSYQSESHLLEQLRPFVDGVILEYGRWRSTFLPQVWEQLTQPGAFLADLKQKAGLPRNFWSNDLRFSRYTVTKWRESEVLERPR